MSGSSGNSLIAIDVGPEVRVVPGREDRGQGRPVPDTDLAQDVGDVTLDGLARQEQSRGDLRIRVAASDELRDLELSRGQLVDAAASRTSPPCADPERAELALSQQFQDHSALCDRES